ncbi:MAG: hypothetical protein AABX50_01820 [Nanoarchaeota archaeon]
MGINQDLINLMSWGIGTVSFFVYRFHQYQVERLEEARFKEEMRRFEAERLERELRRWEAKRLAVEDYNLMINLIYGGKSRKFSNRLNSEKYYGDYPYIWSIYSPNKKYH